MPMRLAILALLTLFGPTHAKALEFADGKLQIHGFASQAVIDSSANRYYGDSPDTSFDFTELGINASYQFNPRLLISGQILSRRAGDMYDGSPSLDYGLIDYTVLSDVQHRLGVRVGRIKNPLGLYNETRDVPFTRPGIFLPQVIYYDKVRNLLLSSDGIMVYGDLYRGFGNLSATVGGGRAIADENVEWAFLGGDFAGDLEPAGLAWLGSLWYATPAEQFKVGLSGVATQLQFDAAPGGVLGAGTIDTIDLIASAEYNARDWTLVAEYSRQPLDWDDFGPFYPFDSNVIEGYYLQGSYRLRPNLEIMARYEEGFADRSDRSGRESSALTGGLTPPYDFFSKIATLGLRWDIHPKVMLRLEYQRHDGTFALSIRENPDPSELTRDWDVFAASLSVRF